MPNIHTGFAVNTGLHPTANVSIGVPDAASSGLLLQEDGVSFFVLESGAGDIALN